MLLIGDEKILLLGASRGLGLKVQRQLQLRSSKFKIRQISRRSDPAFDFSRPEHWDFLLAEIRQIAPSHLWYFAGGGPYGIFEKKEWKDHQWAFRVNFECPAFLLHGLLREPLPSLGQFVAVGSAVAEASPDPKAASYAAAKHALRGLIDSVQAEWAPLEQKPFDLRLFSPTYLDTPLLPKFAEPRQVPGKVRAVEAVAEEFLGWVEDPSEFCRNHSHS